MRILRQHQAATSTAPGIDLTPMLDCMFILLIFFVVSSVFVQEPGIDVEKPDVRGVTRPESDALLVAVTSDNHIYYDGQPVSAAQLATVLRRAAVRPEQLLVIRADRAATHGSFATVYAAAREAGLTRVRFATVEEGSP
jgi:biopolymer transport protein ExbD